MKLYGEALDLLARWRQPEGDALLLKEVSAM